MSLKQLVPNTDEKDIMFVFSEPNALLVYNGHAGNIGEGNSTPLQCSCLKNPRDGGAWWAAIYGVTQSQTRLKRLSSSSSKYYNN